MACGDVSRNSLFSFFRRGNRSNQVAVTRRIELIDAPVSQNNVGIPSVGGEAVMFWILFYEFDASS
jgi:hypothetical protein